MKYILKYLKKYRIRAILAPLFKMLEASFELMVPLVMRKLIDVGIANGDKNYVIKMGMVLIMLTVVGYLASITAQYFSARAAMGVGKQLRGELFRHISSLSYNEIDSLGSSTLITRMSSDVNQVITGVNMFCGMESFLSGFYKTDFLSSIHSPRKHHGATRKEFSLSGSPNQIVRQNHRPIHILRYPGAHQTQICHWICICGNYYY